MLQYQFSKKNKNVSKHTTKYFLGPWVELVVINSLEKGMQTEQKIKVWKYDSVNRIFIKIPIIWRKLSYEQFLDIKVFKTYVSEKL